MAVRSVPPARSLLSLLVANLNFACMRPRYTLRSRRRPHSPLLLPPSCCSAASGGRATSTNSSSPPDSLCWRSRPSPSLRSQLSSICSRAGPPLGACCSRPRSRRSSSASRPSYRVDGSPPADAGCCSSTGARWGSRSPGLCPWSRYPDLLPQGIISSGTTHLPLSAAARPGAALPPGGARLHAAPPSHQRRAERMARDRLHPLGSELGQLLLPSGSPLDLGLHRRCVPSQLLPRPTHRSCSRDCLLLDERDRSRIARGEAPART